MAGAAVTSAAGNRPTDFISPPRVRVRPQCGCVSAMTRFSCQIFFKPFTKTQRRYIPGCNLADIVFMNKNNVNILLLLSLQHVSPTVWCQVPQILNDTSTSAYGLPSFLIRVFRPTAYCCRALSNATVFQPGTQLKKNSQNGIMLQVFPSKRHFPPVVVAGIEQEVSWNTGRTLNYLYYKKNFLQEEELLKGLSSSNEARHHCPSMV